MRWRKLGLVWSPKGLGDWAVSHAMGPTPWRVDRDTIRVFITCLDAHGRGRPGFVDVAAQDPTRVIRVCRAPLLDLGVPGSFDDNGVMAISIVSPAPGVLYMYYAGFELCTQVRYRIFTGLAISRDAGESFIRHSRAAVLDRSDQELYFRCGPYATYDEGVFRLWYIGGSEWTDIGGKQMPVYDLRYLESSDGLQWGPAGTVSLAMTGADEHGFGRPWVVKRGAGAYQLFYSIRRRSVAAYRLGYAESSDGIHWQRKDDEMGLDVTPGAFDSNAIMYSAVISVGARTFCFYNGNDFGVDGFAVAELLP